MIFLNLYEIALWLVSAAARAGVTEALRASGLSDYEGSRLPLQAKLKDILIKQLVALLPL